MCKATVVYEEKLGKRREGWCVYLNKTRDFTFYSDKQVKEKMAQGEKINGLKLDANNHVVMDEAFTTSLLAKTGLATFTPIFENEDAAISGKYYALVRVLNSKAGNEYELVTNRCGVEMVSEGKLLAMLTLISIGGVKLNSTGGLDVCETVEGAAMANTNRKARIKEEGKADSPA